MIYVTIYIMRQRNERISQYYRGYTDVEDPQYFVFPVVVVVVSKELDLFCININYTLRDINSNKDRRI